MARTKKEKEVIEPSSKDMELELDAAWGVLDKLNPDSAILDENSLSLVDDWIDTGSYALNAIKVDDHWADGYTFAIYNYLMLGEQDQAIDLLRKGLKVIPEDPLLQHFEVILEKK